MKKKYILTFVMITILSFLTGLVLKKKHIFQSYYHEYKFLFFEKKITKKNNAILKNQNLGKIFFENIQYNFLKIDLSKYGITFNNDYIFRPLGYVDVYNNKIVLGLFDGKFFISNTIQDIKKNGLKLDELETLNFDFKFNYNDDYSYRNIIIRDIMIDDNHIYVVTNGKNETGNNEYYSSHEVIRGKIDLINYKIDFEKFFNSGEKIYDQEDWSHTGGRIVKYKNDSFLLSISDHALMDNLNTFKKKMNSKNSYIGKIIQIKKNSNEIFSFGHRNTQGLFYDIENDLIFQTEHGPTGGDEINLIKKNLHYGWPIATYGASQKNLDLFRNHKENGYTEPLTYWWPRNCGISEITKVEKRFNKNWKNYTLLSSCLSGSGTNQGESLYRWEFDKTKNKLKKKNQYFIGDRIRDMKYSPENDTIILLLENQKSLVLIYK